MTARATDVIIDALRANGRIVIDRGDDRYSAQCPAHDDHNPSLEVKARKDGKGAVVTCYAGCDYRAVLAAIDLHPRNLYDADAKMRDVYRPNVDYRYPGGRINRRRTNADGRKRFTQSGSKDLSLFLADKIPAGCPLVFLTESEKAALAIWAMGAVAVATGGAMRRCDMTPLRGADVSVVVDRDSAGLRWAKRQQHALDGIAAKVLFVRCPLDIAHADVVEHIDNGFNLDQLEEFDPYAIYDEEPPPDEPPADEPPADEPPQAANNDTSAAIPEPKLWRATDLRPTAQPRWLAKNRIPRAAVSLIIGEEGIGKSLLWVWLTAAITTGQELPGLGIPARNPGHVIIAAITEDDWASVVRPRLEVAQADLSMVRVICTDDDGTGSPMFPRDLQLIRDANPKPDLIVVDAWLDTVPADLQVRDPQQARQALHKWKDVATLGDAAVALICHTNRVATPNARDRYGATAALRQKARMSLYCQTDDDGHLIVGPEKANGTVTVPASLFTIEPVPVFPPTADDDGVVPRLVYAGESDQTARQHLAETFAAQHDTATKHDTVGWLAAYLGEGPQWVNDIMRVGEACGHSKDQLKRAKPRLHVESEHDGTTGAWFWRLPQHEERTPPPCISPLPPCSVAPNTQNQENSSTSQESKRVNGEIRRDERTLDFSVKCLNCSDEIPESAPLARKSGYCTKGRCIQAARAANTARKQQDTP